MRKVLITLLLASAAASPALAGPRDHSDRQQARADRQEAHSQARADRQDARSDAHADRPQARPERSVDRSPVNAPHVDVRHVDAPRGDAMARPGRGVTADLPRPAFNGNRVSPDMRPNRDSVDNRGRSYSPPGPKVIQAPARSQAVRDRRDPRVVRPNIVEDRQVVRRGGALREVERRVPNAVQRRAPVVSAVPRPGTQPPLRTENRRHHDHHWDGNWRHDRRYDWHNYRHHHRSLFHLGFYVDPFGWGYQPFSIGWRMWPSYYGSSFWINNPSMYRLPYAPPGMQWIRYYDDAILVDLYTGQVVDVIQNFFW